MSELKNVSVRLTQEQYDTVDRERKRLIKAEGRDVSRADYFRRFIPTGPTLAKPRGKK